VAYFSEGVIHHVGVYIKWLYCHYDVTSLRVQCYYRL